MEDITKSKKLSEHDIQNLILDYLNKSGIFAFRINNVGVYDLDKNIYRRPGKYSLPGVSDVLGILPDGRFLAIEVKSKTGKVSTAQLAFISKINIKGGLAFIARSLDDVIKVLKEL